MDTNGVFACGFLLNENAFTRGNARNGAKNGDAKILNM
jgi:hypothetical protein